MVEAVTAQQRPPESPDPVSSILRLAGKVLASTTVLTAFLFFFGRQLTSTRMAYFGLDISVLGLSTQDYVVRSADALFIPIGAIILVVLGALCLHRFAMSWLPAHRNDRAPKLMTAAVLIAGLILLSSGLLAVLTPVAPFDTIYLLTPLSPGLGIALVAYSVYIFAHFYSAADLRPATPILGRREGDGAGPILTGETSPCWMSTATIGMVASFVCLSLFWTASDYAKDLGRSRSRDLAAHLDRQPGVTVFAEKRMAISGPGVTEVRLTDEDLAYRYQYTGLRMLLRSNGKYFLLPTGWSRRSGPAIMLNDNANIRLDFEPGGP